MNLIKECRTALGMTQEQLAEKAECSTRSIRNYEAGTQMPTAQTIIRIAKVLKTTVESLYKENAVEAVGRNGGAGN